MIVYTLCCTLSVYLIYKGYKYCVKNKYRERFNSLYQFVGSQNHKGIKRYMVCFDIISQMAYTSLIQKLNRSVKKIDDDTYELKYAIEGKMYIHKIDMYRGPAGFLEAYDADNNKDISVIINMYAGPEKTLKNKNITPGYLGYKNVLISYTDWSEKIFQKNETINID